jgi:hypothetical protein
MAKNMEFPPLEDLGQDFGPEFFELGQLITPEQMKASMVSALAGGGGILVTANVLERIDYFADKPRLKAAAAALLGVVGGRLLWSDADPGRQHMAMGFVGGVAGMGLAKLVSGTFDVDGGLSAVEVMRTPPYQFFSPTRGALPQMAGFGQPIVTDDDPIALDAVEVTADQLGSWMG